MAPATFPGFRVRPRRYSFSLLLLILGPGAYIVPEIVGHKRVSSGHPGCPAYSFNKQTIEAAEKVGLLSKEQDRHLVPTDVPGVGQYNPDPRKMRKREPVPVIPTALRFAKVSALMAYKTNMYVCFR